MPAKMKFLTLKPAAKMTRINKFQQQQKCIKSLGRSTTNQFKGTIILLTESEQTL